MGLPPEVQDAPDSQRVGRYVAVDRLGAGAMGEVWRAWDTDLNRWVALKLLKHVDSEHLARFMREAQTAASLSHPNIAAIYEVGEDRGRYFIAMQLVAGRSLGQLGRRPARRAAEAVRDAALAVHHAHEHGIVHRDLKPDNIMVEDQPPYVSPEQAQGRRLGRRADVYSLGATLFASVEGRPPFAGANAVAVLRQALDGEPARLAGELGLIVGKAMDRDPQRRYATLADMAADLTVSATRSRRIFRSTSRAYVRCAFTSPAGRPRSAPTSPYDSSGDPAGGDS